MLKARINNTVVIGLSEENIRRLKQGKPIVFSGSEYQMPGLDNLNFLIMYGVTEGAIKAELDAAIRP